MATGTKEAVYTPLRQTTGNRALITSEERRKATVSYSIVDATERTEFTGVCLALEH
jgi:hypothetical protein